MTLGARIGIGVAGALLLLIGWGVRSFQEDYSSLGYVVLTAPDGTVGAYQPDDSYDGPFETRETSEDGVFQVLHQGTDVVFTGTEEETAFWIETKGAEPAFTGTLAEVEAYVDEQEAAEDDFTWSIILMVAGGLVLVGAVALGRD